jgi:hypothetical protein
MIIFYIGIENPYKKLRKHTNNKLVIKNKNNIYLPFLFLV